MKTETEQILEWQNKLNNGEVEINCSTFMTFISKDSINDNQIVDISNPFKVVEFKKIHGTWVCVKF